MAFAATALQVCQSALHRNDFAMAGVAMPGLGAHARCHIEYEILGHPVLDRRGC